ncbi:hypothetical protein [Arthrobacter sp. NPDC057013]|uniref:hypothetical protein n=1 Tax=Arthrobacter sp. NPDC057013 TaxID=3345999 RepID=UPI00362A7C3E
MRWGTVHVLTENIGDYCYGQRTESFEACMRHAKERSDSTSAMLTFIVIGVIVAIFFYNRGKRKAAEAAAAQAEQTRRGRLSPEKRVAEDVEAARVRAVQREQARSDAEELEALRRMWASGFFKPGVPLPPERQTDSRPKPEGNAAPGWYDAPPGDGYGLYYRQKYAYQFWNGTDWDPQTSPPSQYYYWTRRR